MVTKQPIDGNKLLYHALTILVLCSYTIPVIYGLVVSFIRTGSSVYTWLLLLIIVLLLLSLKPARLWVQPKVHHLVYALDDPQLELIGRMSQSLAQPSSDEPLVASICETIARTVKVPYVALEMLNGETSSYGLTASNSQLADIEINYGSDYLGKFQVASRLPHVPLSSGELWLLESLARQAGIALHAAQVSDDLQASREQLVLAREEERRRIRRDLHDGLGPTLASVQLQLGALRRMLRSDPAEAETLIDDLRNDVSAATAEIRQLVYELRPPMLDEFGLVEAIKNFKLGDEALQLKVIAPEPMPQLSAALEVAVYRITSEAIHNVTKHANASTCVVEICIEGKSLILTVDDNGTFLPANSQPGVGLHSMQERAVELGGSFELKRSSAGGVCIEVHLPLGARSSNG